MRTLLAVPQRDAHELGRVHAVPPSGQDPPDRVWSPCRDQPQEAPSRLAGDRHSPQKARLPASALRIVSQRVLDSGEQGRHREQGDDHGVPDPEHQTEGGMCRLADTPADNRLAGGDTGKTRNLDFVRRGSLELAV